MSFFAHRHAYEVVAVQPRGMPLTGRMTVVLWRCRRGCLTSQVVGGEWTLAQVRGENAAPSPPGEKVLTGNMAGQDAGKA